MKNDNNLNPEAQEFVKFCNKQGIKFVDIKTGKEIKVEVDK